MKTNLRLATIIVVTLASLFLVANVMAEVSTYYREAGSYISIPDPGTIISTLNVEDQVIVEDLDVVVYITHRYCADLDVYLIGPDGTEVELFTDIGGNGRHFWGTILDDEATSSIRRGLAPFTGRYRPEGKLSDFDGRSAKGEWKLKVTDDDDVLSGELHGWGFVFTYIQPVVTFREIKSIDVSADADGKTLLGLLAIDGVAVKDLILGTTTADFEKFPNHPAAYADNFDLITYASLNDSTLIQTIFSQPVSTIFILERGANDSGSFQPIDAFGNPIGGMLPFTPDDFGLGACPVSECEIAGQKAGFIAVEATNGPIHGLQIFPPRDKLHSIDPASISAIPAP